MYEHGHPHYDWNWLLVPVRTTFLYLRRITYTQQLLALNNLKITSVIMCRILVLCTDVPCHIPLMSLFSKMSQQYDAEIRKLFELKFHPVLPQSTWRPISSSLDQTTDITLCRTLNFRTFPPLEDVIGFQFCTLTIADEEYPYTDPSIPINV